jgi:hypothetical protein
LVGARLLGLDRARVGLYGPNLRLLRLNRTTLKLIGAVVWLYRSNLRLIGAVVRLNGADFGLARSYARLVGTDWLYLRAAVWFAGAKS